MLNCRGLHVTIADKTICRDLHFGIEAGQRWAILGANGTGKTTLLHTLAGLRAADAGEIALHGRPLAGWPRRERAQRIGVLFQHQEDPFPASVLEIVLMGLHPHLPWWAWEGPDEVALATRALARMGLEDHAHRSVNTLSGGERQRAAIATLLLQNPDLMLLDEPANHLDLGHQIRALEVLCAAAPNRAVVMVLHDVNLALRYCDHALLLCGSGEIMVGRCEEVVTEENLRALYGHPLRRVTGPHGPAYLPG